MHIAIYGGSFNPPHIGHIEAAEAALSVLKADKLIVIPAFSAPLKDTEADSPNARARLEMTRIAFSGMDAIEVSDIEIVREGTSYTVDTLKALKKKYPHDELFLMMGTDQVEQFSRWKDYRRILELCTIAPFPRKSGEIQRVFSAAKALEQNFGAKTEVISFTPTDISSTALREMLPTRQGRGFFTDGVYSEIIKHRYYGAKPELEWLRTKAYAYLDPKRVAHVAGCEQEAVRLAKRWGADEDDASEAGILHDITKKFKGDDQLKLCRQYDIMTDTDEKENYKLLHSKTGAALSRDLFGISDEVYGAIFWHTTGKADMTLLEKIIYIADYIEPNRSFDGVEKLRALAYESLDKTLILGLQMSVEDLLRHGAKPHASSLDALNWLLAHQ
ncbi:MAG: nicotinate (nicotinamide) nucleotide adenylyltransferase [Clostridia bacterium]|nr:nicotinate (nicotinamide) nucleotide adenylyltransferase [Clostridia bacterium]